MLGDAAPRRLEAVDAAEGRGNAQRAAAVAPFALGSSGPREIAGQEISVLGWMPFTFPFNLTGQPAASVPAGVTDDGLPVGLQIVGRRNADRTVLAASAAFEAACPWSERQPPP